MNRCLTLLQQWLFTHRGIVVGVALAFTLGMGLAATRLHLDAGYEKQMPIGHEYIKTIEQYRGLLFSGNRLTVVVKARHGTIFTKEGLARLYAVTEAVRFLPHVDRASLQSLWSPSAQVYEITEDGFRAEPLIASTVTADHLTDDIIAGIEQSTTEGGFVGSLVSRDRTAAMVVAELSEQDGHGQRIDYVALNHEIEAKIRAPFEDAGYEIEIIGFAKQIGDIADAADSVLHFCLITIVLTAVAVYWYCRSIRFTILPIVCSLMSLVWQFGTLTLMGFGLDPLAVLVPFLVFAIGVSHGVQQINFIVRELAAGQPIEAAARASFTGLLIPGSLALVTALVSFLTLILIPIPMVRDLAVVAALGVGYKIITNLILLPVLASFAVVTKAYGEAALARRERWKPWLAVLSRAAKPRIALVIVVVSAGTLAMAMWQSRDRVVGSLQPGADELSPQSRYNRSAEAIAENFDIGLDWLSVVVEAPPGSCQNPALGTYVDALTAAAEHAPGVVSATSYSEMLKTYNEGYNEGNPKMFVVPIDPVNYASLSEEIRRNRGYVSGDCAMAALHLYLTDHRARTIEGVITAVRNFADRHPVADFHIRLAAGNAGVAAAINDEVEKSEMPMLVDVYAAIVILVFLAYRDIRATVSCCVPLTVGTFLGYWLMKALGIGLTVATLPVMVLAVGIGVDYAFYIYNRLQIHLARGEAIVPALDRSIQEVGMATIFTAVTLALGVATWSFSPLRFQADMGKLLASMFLINLVMTMTVLPALAIVLDRLFPRRTPPHVPGYVIHD